MKLAKLINVTDKNNNKFYDMVENPNGTFTVSWGRVGSKPATKIYKSDQWFKIYNSKITKGYKDITDLVKVNKKIDIKASNTESSFLLNTLYKYTSNQLSENYYVSSKNVTSLQLKKAQQYLNDALYYKNIEDRNKSLLELYKIIPRKMDNVNNYLYKNENQFFELIDNEQQLLNNLIVDVETDNNMIEYLNIVIDLVNDEDLIIINNLINDTNDCNKYKKTIKKAYRISNNNTQTLFDNYVNSSRNKTVQLVWHGSRNPNWLSILKNGLKIRPSGVQLSGNAYGNGIYGSTCLDKSLSYTGNDSDKFLSIQEFHIGNQFVYHGWYNGNSFSLSYEELKKREYDSTFVKPGKGLVNNEYIIYNEQQTTIKYLIWV